MVKPLNKHGDVAGERFRIALRQLMARGRFTCRALSEEHVGIDPRTIESYRTGGKPGFDNLFELLAFFGPALAEPLLNAVGMTGARWMEGQHLSPQHVQVSVADLMLEFSTALEDMRLDHAEWRTLGPKVEQLQQMLSEFAQQNPHSPTVEEG